MTYGIFFFFQVKIWFQNRRSKYKKLMKQNPGIGGPGGAQNGPPMDQGGMSPPPVHTPTSTGQAPTPSPQGAQGPPPQNGQPNGPHTHGHAGAHGAGHGANPATPSMMGGPPPNSMSPPVSWGAASDFQLKSEINCSSNSTNSTPTPTHNAYMSQYPWYSQNPLAAQQHSLLT